MTVPPDLSNLEPLLARIKRDAQQEADGLAAEAEARAERIMAEARSEAEAEAERILAEAHARARQREEAEEAEARRRGRFQRLAVKHQFLEEVFQEVQAQLRGGSKESFRRLVEALLLSFAESGSLSLIVEPSEHSWLDEPFLNQLQDKLDKAGKGCRLEAVEERTGLGGGLVLRGGRREIDLSLPSLLGQLRENTEAHLAEELFPQKEEFFTGGEEARAEPR